MPPKRSASSSSGSEKKKRPTKVMSLQKKGEVLDMLRTGMSQTRVGKHFGVNESTIRSIKSKEREIRDALSFSFHGSEKRASKVRERNIIKMENALGLWIENARERNVMLSGNIIRNKASSLYEQLTSEAGTSASTSTEPQAGVETEPQAGASDEVETQGKKGKAVDFQASRGWLEGFLKRLQMRNVRLHGEAASADHEAAKIYPAKLQQIIEENGYKPEQIFNMDETGLYWKKMPATTYVTKNELKAPGFKAQKDRVTFILCGNAAGHLIKSGFIYKSKNPRALKHKNKNCLPVYWMSHPKAWINQVLTGDWFHQCFVPETTRYLRDLGIEYKVLLIMDNASGHATDLTYEGVRVEFLPPNTTSLLQPMDQGVIRSFKALYTASCMQRLVDAMDLTRDFSIKTYWKSFTIASCLSMVKTALEQIKKETVNSSWKELLPKFVNDDKGFSPAQIQAAAVSNALRLAHLVGREGFDEITSKDIDALIDAHAEELTNDELIELTKSASEEEDEQQEEAVIKNLTIENLSHMSHMLAALQQEMEIQDPDMTRALKFKNGLDGVFRPYRDMLTRLKREREQLPITAFFPPLKKQTLAPPAAEQPPPAAAAEQPPPAAAAEPDDVVIVMDEVEALLEEEELDEPPPFEGFEDA